MSAQQEMIMIDLSEVHNGVDATTIAAAVTALAQELYKANATPERDAAGHIVEKPFHQAAFSAPENNQVKVTFRGEWKPEEKTEFASMVINRLRIALASEQAAE